jgi:hypothetical protein
VLPNKSLFWYYSQINLFAWRFIATFILLQQ